MATPRRPTGSLTRRTEPPGQQKLVVTPADPVDGTFTVVVDYHGIPSDPRRHRRVAPRAGCRPRTARRSSASRSARWPASPTTTPRRTRLPTRSPWTCQMTARSPPTASSASSAIASGRRTWVWEQTQPMASELALISIGQYDVLESDGQPLRRSHRPRVVIRRLRPHAEHEGRDQWPAGPALGGPDRARGSVRPLPRAQHWRRRRQPRHGVRPRDAGSAVLPREHRPDHLRPRARPPVVRRRGCTRRLERAVGQRGDGDLGTDAVRRRQHRDDELQQMERIPTSTGRSRRRG